MILFTDCGGEANISRPQLPEDAFRTVAMKSNFQNLSERQKLIFCSKKIQGKTGGG